MGLPTILVADDDPETRYLLRIILKDAGMQAIFAENGSRMLDLWRRNPVDVIILDVMMPVMDGIEACQRIRRTSRIPIIFLTAKGQEQDVVKGLEIGADDYVVKPFRAAELVARIRVILNRTAREQEARGKHLSFDKLVLDLESRRVISRGRSIEVTPLEFQLLRYLMQNVGIVISKEDLLQNVWGYAEAAGDMNLIEAAVRRLRRKLELDPSQPKYIQTVWGAGYRFGE
ncbi:MAG TPA: response regulator transcription factor [Anaerolineales bacterium]|nr:response regulator transcription factor [Anaerolineales bacterium]